MKLRCILAVVAVLGIAACGKDKGTSGEGYSITFPAGWEKQDIKFGGFSGIASLSPLESGDKFRENINIMVETLPSSMTAKSYAQVAMAQLPAMYKDFKVESSGSEQINGMPTEWMVYTHSMGNPLKVLQYIAVKGSKAFVITCTAAAESFDSYKDRFQSSVRTIEFD